MATTQIDALEKKYQERKVRLLEELEKVESRLSYYASLKSEVESPDLPEQPAAKSKKMYRGRPVD